MVFCSKDYFNVFEDRAVRGISNASHSTILLARFEYFVRPSVREKNKVTLDLKRVIEMAM
jgi:hypothetical protein